MIFHCADQNRKALLLTDPTVALNGIDFLEVQDATQDAIQDALAPATPTLQLHCLKPLTTTLTPANILITGGESIIGLAATSVTLASDPTVLLVQTDRSGDFSTYTLRLVNSVTQATGNPFDLTDVLQGFDPQLAEATFSFKIDCGPDFDCLPQPCADIAPALTPPPINYLAKDYGSFRTLLLDRLTQLLPAWSPTSEADLGITLAELIAYRGDLLSYRQDAIATEAYLGTARSRISLRRHALLVDYRVHDGANARAWVHLEVSGDPGQAVFLDRAATRFYTSTLGPIRLGNEEAALSSGVHFFEPMQNALLHPEHNRMRFYLWGDPRAWTDARCCLPKGATEATLHGAFPNLQPGDVLIFQEVLAPETGIPADADLRHRHAVRLTQVATRDAYGNPLADPLFLESTNTPVLLTQIQWAPSDALPFPLCLASRLSTSAGRMVVSDVTVVLGNIVLADHGLTVPDVPLGRVPNPTLFYPPNAQGTRFALPVRFRPTLPDSPLTQSVPLPLAGSPVTPTIVMLSGTGALPLTDANGFACLLIQPGNPALWPQFFGVQATKNAANPAHFDLIVFYNPPGLAAAVPVEAFFSLSLNPAEPSFVASQLNTRSRLLRVPSTFVPPAELPAAIPATIAMLSNTGTTTLTDTGTPAIPFLTIQPTNPADWLQSLGVIAQGNQRTPTLFNLSLVYNPDDGAPGVQTPITLERFVDLTLATVPATFTSASQLISVQSFAQAPNPTLSAADLTTFDPADAVPAITLIETSAPDPKPVWLAQQNLLACSESTCAFVVETEFDGTATLRFATPGTPGNETEGTNGMVPAPGTAFAATFRIGNGTSGNLGAESLTQLSAADARILRCTNPLPASGGADPETPEQIRRRAPQAFLAPERSITLADYRRVAESDPSVNQAVASLRWTGSWYSVFLAVEPKGGGNLTSALQKSLYTNVDRFRLAGQDLELESPQYVSLQITLQVTVDPAYFRADVQQTLLQVLGNRTLPDGRKGLFHPDNFDFGQTVYLSPIYAAARMVPGVLQVAALDFRPQGTPTNDLSSGEIKLKTLQVARLENDPSFPDHGQLTLIMQGGK